MNDSHRFRWGRLGWHGAKGAGVGGAVGLVRDKADQLIEDAQGTECLT